MACVQLGRTRQPRRHRRQSAECGGCGLLRSADQYQADAIANAYPDSSKVIIRIGYEFTNNWGHGVCARNGLWPMLPRLATSTILSRATLPNARFDWCDLRSFWELYGESTYPGVDYVDICGIDIYWRNTDGAPITGTKEPCT